ncbi:MAG TPA: LysR substrate-binding domain-containing protein [Pseudogracilibacillus sp.]|nr:LysR substrate-binding domain-containing protein [Pseudogracilibacillus sp.]
MDIQQLRYFVAVARHKNFTKASRALHVSQPSISKRLKQLEDELNATLLDRSERKVELTDVGHSVHTHALQLLQIVEDIYQSADSLADTARGSIQLGVMPTIGVLLFPKVLADFRKSHPQIELFMVESAGKQLEKQVADGEIDLGVTVLPVQQDNLYYLPLLNEQLVVVSHPEHWLKEATTIPLAKLAKEKFVFFTEEYILHDVVMKHCLQQGFEPTIVYESALWDIVLEMVAAEFGISIVPKSVAERMDNRISVTSLASPAIDWQLALIYHKHKHLSYAVQAFITYMKELAHNDNFLE